MSNFKLILENNSSIKTRKLSNDFNVNTFKTNHRKNNSYQSFGQFSKNLFSKSNYFNTKINDNCYNNIIKKNIYIKVKNLPNYKFYENIKWKNIVKDKINYKCKKEDYNKSIHNILLKFQNYFFKNKSTITLNQIKTEYDNNLNKLLKNLNYDFLFNLKLNIKYNNINYYTLSSIKNKSLILGIIRYVKLAKITNFDEIIKKSFKLYVKILNIINNTLVVNSNNINDFYYNNLKFLIQKGLLSTFKLENNEIKFNNLTTLDKEIEEILVSLFFKLNKNSYSKLLFPKLKSKIKFKFMSKKKIKKNEKQNREEITRKSVTFRPSILKTSMNKNFVLNELGLKNKELDSKKLCKNWNILKDDIIRNKSIFNHKEQEFYSKLKSIRQINKEINIKKTNFNYNTNEDVQRMFGKDVNIVINKLKEVKSNLKKMKFNDFK